MDQGLLWGCVTFADAQLRSEVDLAEIARITELAVVVLQGVHTR